MSGAADAELAGALVVTLGLDRGSGVLVTPRMYAIGGIPEARVRVVGVFGGLSD